MDGLSSTFLPEATTGTGPPAGASSKSLALLPSKTDELASKLRDYLHYVGVYLQICARGSGSLGG